MLVGFLFFSVALYTDALFCLGFAFVIFAVDIGRSLKRYLSR
jgi:hypothetical protein